MIDLIHAIKAEADRAQARYGAFRSTHEGYGVLAEEVAELLDAIRTNSPAAIRGEAIQIAAVALRIAESCDANVAMTDRFAARSGFVR